VARVVVLPAPAGPTISSNLRGPMTAATASACPGDNPSIPRDSLLAPDQIQGKTPSRPSLQIFLFVEDGLGGESSIHRGFCDRSPIPSKRNTDGDGPGDVGTTRSGHFVRQSVDELGQLLRIRRHRRRNNSGELPDQFRGPPRRLLSHQHLQPFGDDACRLVTVDPLKTTLTSDGPADQPLRVNPIPHTR
jgi:hypothetical protein